MADSEKPGDSESKDLKSPNLWLRAGAAAALGFEFVGFVLAGVLIGTQLDARFDSSPLGLLVCLGLAMVAAGWHIYLVAQRFVLADED